MPLRDSSGLAFSIAVLFIVPDNTGLMGWACAIVADTSIALFRLKFSSFGLSRYSLQLMQDQGFEKFSVEFPTTNNRPTGF
jgi:hypothetical protein